MSKQDTAILMGTSLLSPLFNTNRWDYAYTSWRGSGTPQIRNLTLYFSGNKLSAIEHHPYSHDAALTGGVLFYLY